jgi:hypothetical protein
MEVDEIFGLIAGIVKNSVKTKEKAEETFTALLQLCL